MTIKEFVDTYKIPIAITLVIIGFVLFYYFSPLNAKERFWIAPFDPSLNEVLPKIVSQSTFANDSLDSGLVFKENTNGQFNYIFKFNLPIPIGGDYASTPGEYTALLGTSEKDLVPVGKLTRIPSGWFYLHYVSDKNYTFSQIVMDTGKVKNVIVQGNI